MGFQHGLSGLNAAARNLDVIGHNVSNASTIGAKSARTEFADRYANSVSGGSSFSGLGVSVNAVSQSFAQGDLMSTNNPLDLAINGSGFFQLNSNSTGTSYTRNGQFKLDADGFVMTSDGQKLAGYPVDAQGSVQIGVPTDLQVNSADLAPKTTTSMDASINLDARGEVPATPFDFVDATTYNAATSIKVYDAQGVDTTLALYFRKTAGNTWDVYGTGDGVPIGTTPLGEINFDADGLVDDATTTNPMPITVPGGSGTPIAVDMNLGELTQFGSLFGVNALRQDGYATGKLVSYGVDAEGIVMARYTNGENRAQGQVALANFANPQGLAAAGGNDWVDTARSGPPLLGTPGSASLGAIQSGALEQSNVDLTDELVNMIMAQRSYQANAQTIRAQDQIVQTVINLR